ncbi:MAG: sigma 54-interacting transcriptional regulator [candidate division Zixibacteria bacterium]|nr:sigma 54-interacting transcriptional regulator [candidate division Zixibacteria bacterium]
MNLSSPKVTFDNRLLTVEELFRQRKYRSAIPELTRLTPDEFESRNHELGLFCLLQAERALYETKYREALEFGLKACRYLADLPLNRRYGRVQWVLSKSYSAVGDLKNAEIRARDAVAAFRRASDPTGQVDSLNELARIAYIRNEYQAAIGFLTDAAGLCGNDARRHAQMTGNLGRIRLYTGDWAQAEQDMNEALEYAVANEQEDSQVVNYLSLGLLHIRRRQFTMARRKLDKALEIISRLGLKREKVIYLEFAGELALERGDIFKAKAILSDAYTKSMMLAPESSLVSQTARRAAEVELALDNLDEAMKYAQKALEVALMLGEKEEIGLARRIIAMVFAAKGDSVEALEYINDALEIQREQGDPYRIGRTLLVMADIKAETGVESVEKHQSLFDEAHRIFKRLKLSYWVAETDLRAGLFACQQGNLSRGFRKLSRAEKVFDSLNDKNKVRAVNKFLNSLAEQAVALSISRENEFKIFGNLITPQEYSDIKTSQIDELLEILLKETKGHRAVVYSPDFESCPVTASFTLAPQQVKKFIDGFQQLLGEEIARSRPTLVLDCRRDPYINGLFVDFPEVVASVIVVPFTMSDGSRSFLYIEKLTDDNTLNPFSQTELNFAVGFTDIIAFKWTEIQKNKLLEDNRRLKRQLQENAAFPNIITQNDDMMDVLAQVRQVVDSSISVSIEGDTGTGKDLLAKAIHYNSLRRDRRFISVNCAALPETLLESELFGYKRGAFTGADRDKSGLFEEADGGTFFLDEIADMPLSIQAKVLRVLETKEIVRLGETVPRKVDVRIISATNKDLREEMNRGLFRQDLYYRLSALTFRLPPLRDRREDILLLVAHYLEGSGKNIHPEVMKLLVNYDWPGNVRELENEIKKLVLLSGAREEIGIEVLSGKVRAVGGDGNGQDRPAAVPADDVCFDAGYSLYDYLASHEKRFIIKALKDKRGVKKHAAELLNIPESTLRLKIKQYNIDLKDLRSLH